MVFWSPPHSLSRDPNQKLQHLGSLKGTEFRIWYSFFFSLQFRSSIPFYVIFSVYAQKVKWAQKPKKPCILPLSTQVKFVLDS